jgi:hypothetical protein
MPLRITNKVRKGKVQVDELIVVPTKCNDQDSDELIEVPKPPDENIIKASIFVKKKSPKK